MPEICCVDGCVPAKDDVTYFKFPNSRALRRKWLDAIPSTSIKVTLDTVVCSRHFLAEQYEVVRQKRRLKAKVVPSVFDQIKTPTAKDDELISSKQTDTANDRVASDVTTDNKPDTEQRTNSPNHRLQENTSKNESCMTNGLKEDIVKRSQPDNVSITDSEISNKDIEDIITNYQIKQTRPVHQGTETETGGNRETGGSTLAANACIEVEVPPFAGEIQVERNDKIEIGRNGEMEIGKNGEIQMRREEASQVIDVDDEAEPVFIEVSVGKGGDQDCVMLLESVQCDVDPRCLVLPERAPASPPARTDGPISLLTSSDEDEVIIEEPHYDLVEVSDETDEDDVPLVRLAGAAPPFAPHEHVCLQCRYSSTSPADYARHLERHAALRVCALCGHTTASRQQHARHQRQHRAERRHHCPHCRYRARHRMSLLYHMRAHRPPQPAPHPAPPPTHARKFPCGSCGYVAARAADLRRHRARRHGDGDDDDDDYVP